MNGFHANILQYIALHVQYLHTYVQLKSYVMATQVFSSVSIKNYVN